MLAQALKLSDTAARYLFYWLWAFVSRLLPITLLSIEFDLFESEQTTAYKGIVILSFLLLWAAIGFWSEFTDWAKTLPEGIGRESLIAVGSLGPYLLFWIFMLYSKIAAEQIFYISTMLLATQTIGVVFKAEHNTAKRKLLASRGYVNVLK